MTPGATEHGEEAIAQSCRALLDEPVSNVNLLVPVLDCVRRAEREAPTVDAIQTLRIYFVDALHSGTGHDDDNGPAAKLLAFARSKHAIFEDHLLEHLRSDRPAKVQLAGLMALMEGVRSTAVGHFAKKPFERILDHVLCSRYVASDVVAAFIPRYAEYADVRYYLLKWVTATASLLATSEEQPGAPGWHASRDDRVAVLFDVLAALPARLDFDANGVVTWCGASEVGLVHAAPIPREGSRARRKRKRDGASGGQPSQQEEGYRRLWASAKAQTHAYSDAWLEFLRVPLPPDLYKRVLQLLMTTVMPSVRNPIVLSDFLTKSVDKGGLVAILALHALFTLVTKHGLEYPDFYRRLYTLLTPQVFTAKYRLKFLQLTDVFLASSLVPAYTAAAFVKRFATIALTVPPTGALVCLAFMHNLIRRHPSCMCLVHQPVHPDESAAGRDPYEPECADPAHSRAIESSLWELHVLRSHSSAAVADFVQQLDRDLSDRKHTAEVDMALLLPRGYTTELATELARKLRKAPAVAFYAPKHAPRGLFDSSMAGFEL